MYRNAFNLPDFDRSVNDLRSQAARECAHCGDFLTPRQALTTFCAGPRDKFGPRLPPRSAHKLLPRYPDPVELAHEAKLYQVEFSSAGQSGQARECRHCGDMLTPEQFGADSAWTCYGPTAVDGAHEFLELPGELPADFYARRDEVQAYVTAAAENLRRALAVITGELPQLAYQVGGPLALAERRVAGLRRTVEETFGTAALDAAIIAASTDDNLHYHKPELSSTGDDLPGWEGGSAPASFGE